MQYAAHNKNQTSKIKNGVWTCDSPLTRPGPGDEAPPAGLAAGHILGALWRNLIVPTSNGFKDSKVNHLEPTLDFFKSLNQTWKSLLYKIVQVDLLNLSQGALALLQKPLWHPSSHFPH